MSGQRLQVLGRQELLYLAGDFGELPSALNVDEELQEDDIPSNLGKKDAETGSYWLRTLQEVALYNEENGLPAHIESLDDKSVQALIVFGTLLPPSYGPKTPKAIKVLDSKKVTQQQDGAKDSSAASSSTGSKRQVSKIKLVSSSERSSGDQRPKAPLLTLKARAPTSDKNDSSAGASGPESKKGSCGAPAPALKLKIRLKPQHDKQDKQQTWSSDADSQAPPVTQGGAADGVSAGTGGGGTKLVLPRKRSSSQSSISQDACARQSKSRSSDSRARKESDGEDSTEASEAAEESKDRHKGPSTKPTEAHEKGGLDAEDQRRMHHTNTHDNNQGQQPHDHDHKADDEKEDWDDVGVRVSLRVTEWCIDYSEGGHAVLWLVSDRGNWYRVAGTQYPYLRPHPLHRRIFDSAAAKFLACAVTAKQLIASYRKDANAPYKTVLKNIVAASHGKLTEEALLEEADFIAAQMADLTDPDEIVQRSFADCPFVEGLKEEAKVLGYKPMSRKDKDRIVREVAKAQREIVSGYVEAYESDDGLGSRGGGSTSRSRTHQRSNSNDSYTPLNVATEEADDLTLLGEAAHTPRPDGQRSSSLPPDVFQSLLVAWNVVDLCGPDMLKLKPFSLDMLEKAFAGSMRGLCAPLVQDCINRMLIVVLRDRRNPAKPFNVFITEECIELKEEAEQAGGGGVGGGVGGGGGGGGGGGDTKGKRGIETFEAVLTKGIRSGEDLLPYGWQELVRLLIAERYRLPVEDYLDPLAELQRLLEDLLLNNKQALPFYTPVDPSKDGMEDYREKIEFPMDLGTVVYRLKTGWYEQTDVDLCAENGHILAPLTPAPTDAERAKKQRELEKEDVNYQYFRTKGMGHKGAVQDVRLVFSNCYEYYPGDAPLVELANQYSEELEEAMDKRILQPMAVRQQRRDKVVKKPKRGKRKDVEKEAADETGETDWAEVVNELGRVPYVKLPMKTKAAVLRWLADEVMCTAAGREALDEIAGAKDGVRKMAIKRKAAGYTSDDEGGGNASWTREEERRFQSLKRMVDKETRLRPLGVDRHRRRYWFFPSDERRRVYAESVADGPCDMVYATRESLQALIGWLSEHTPKERPLRDAVWTVMERYYGEDGGSVKMDTGDGDASGGANNDADKPPAYESYVNDAARSDPLALPPVPLHNDQHRHVLYPIGITAKERATLGLLYADQELKLTAYRDVTGVIVRESPIPRMGLAMHDRLVMVNGRMITGPEWPAAEIEDPSTLQYTKDNEPEEFQLRILRESVSPQVDLKQLAPRVNMTEWGYVQGYLLHMEREANHPLALGPQWESRRVHWREQVVRGSNGVGLREAVLELEAAMRSRGTLLGQKEDKDGRSRGVAGKWRQHMGLSTTPSQMLLGLRLLYSLIDRRILDRALRPLDRMTWTELLPEEKRIEMPELGALVIYYPQGHRASLKHSDKFKGPMWGVDVPQDQPKKPLVQVCQVMQIEYFSLPPSKDPFGVSAWARIKLARLATRPYYAFVGSLRMLRPYEPRSATTRLLARVVQRIKELPGAEQFAIPVSSRDYPDYYEVTRTPMDLTTLLSRVRRHYYKGIHDFVQDLELIASNCHRYCDTRFPALPPQADRVVQYGKDLLASMEDRIRAAARDGEEMAKRADLFEPIKPCEDQASSISTPTAATADVKPPVTHTSVASTATVKQEGTVEPEPPSGRIVKTEPGATTTRPAAIHPTPVPAPAPYNGYPQPVPTQPHAAQPRATYPLGAPAQSTQWHSQQQQQGAGGWSGSYAATPNGPSASAQGNGVVGYPTVQQQRGTDHKSVPTRGYPSPAPGVAQPQQQMPRPTAHAGYSSTRPQQQQQQAYGYSSQQQQQPQQQQQQRGQGNAYQNAAAAGYHAQPHPNNPYQRPEMQPQSGAAAAPEAGGGLDPYGRPKQPPQPPPSAAPAPAPQQQITSVQTFSIGVWLSNSVPEFMVTRQRYEEAVKNAWRQEQRFQTRWASPEGKDEGGMYTGTIVGMRPPDPESELVPWEAFQVEWDGEGDVSGFVNPWAIEALPQDYGPPPKRCEYPPLRKLYTLHGSLLDGMPRRKDTYRPTPPPAPHTVASVYGGGLTYGYPAHGGGVGGQYAGAAGQYAYGAGGVGYGSVQGQQMGGYYRAP